MEQIKRIGIVIFTFVSVCIGYAGAEVSVTKRSLQNDWCALGDAGLAFDTEGNIIVAVDRYVEGSSRGDGNAEDVFVFAPRNGRELLGVRNMLERHALVMYQRGRLEVVNMNNGIKLVLLVRGRDRREDGGQDSESGGTTIIEGIALVHQVIKNPTDMESLLTRGISRIFSPIRRIEDASDCASGLHGPYCDIMCGDDGCSVSCEDGYDACCGCMPGPTCYCVAPSGDEKLLSRKRDNR